MANQWGAGRSAFLRMLDKVRIVDIEDVDSCWLFEGALDQNGHGNVRYKTKKGKWSCRKAHQVAYEGYHRKLPRRPWVVRHTCDVRNCVAERHLIPGKHKDNMADMVSRGRQRNQYAK